MTLKEKFLEKAFCMCEDESQIDNFIDIAEEFAIGFAAYLDGYLTRTSTSIRNKTIKELLEIYKKEKGL